MEPPSRCAACLQKVPLLHVAAQLQWEWALQREGSPQVALEGVDGATFKVHCWPAESLIFPDFAAQLYWDCHMS